MPSPTWGPPSSGRCDPPRRRGTAPAGATWSWSAARSTRWAPPAPPAGDWACSADGTRCRPRSPGVVNCRVPQETTQEQVSGWDYRPSGPPTYPRPLVKNRTFVMCKPDAVERGLVGEVVARLERKGPALVAAELRQADCTLPEQHYA